MKSLSLFLFLQSLSSIAMAGGVSDKIPDGMKINPFRFEYDAEKCGGEIGFTLNDHDDCAMDLKNFFVRTNETKSCDVRIYVELPPGLSMTTSKLALEGDYQLDSGGTVSISGNFSLEGTNEEITLWQRWSNRDAGLISNTFLEEQKSTGEGQLFSPCGGVAVFSGTFTINATSASGKKLSIIDLGRTQLGVPAQETKPSAFWGWDYKRCDGHDG